MYKEKVRSRRPRGAAGGQAAMAGGVAPAAEARSWPRRSALGARRSALGARRSALGARRSALGARRSALGARRSALGARRSALGARRSALGARRSALLIVTSPTASNHRAQIDPIAAPLPARVLNLGGVHGSPPMGANHIRISSHCKRCCLKGKHKLYYINDSIQILLKYPPRHTYARTTRRQRGETRRCVGIGPRGR